MLLHVQLVQLRQGVEPGALLLGAHPLRRLQIDNRIADRAEQRALIAGRHEAGAPVVRPTEWATPVVVHDDKGRQAGAFGPKAVGDPGTHARKSHPNLTGLHFIGRLHVIVRAPVDRPQEGQLVDLGGEMRKELRHVHAALPVLLEREGARHQRAREALTDDDAAVHFAVERLSGIPRQGGLRVERVHLADPAAHEERNDGSRAGRVVG